MTDAWGLVPKRHGAAAPDFQQKPWADWFQTAYECAIDGGIVVLCGSRGSGKTQIGSEIIRRAGDQGFRPYPRYTHVMDLFLAIRAGYSAGTSERESVDLYLKPSILVIDEVQDRAETPWENQMLRYVIDKRYSAMMGTVMIGNLIKGELMEAMGKSVSSRIQETGTFIECVGVNWRAGA